jgi:hypothetical protein
MSHRHTALAVLTILASAASAQLATAPAAFAAPNPCALVTAAEASAAMHVKALPGKAHNGRGGASCRYYSPNHQMNVFVQTIGADDMTGAMQFGGKPVPGIGDQAVWAAGSLFVKKGGNYAQVGLYLSPASMQKMDPAVIPLGKAAASRM